MVLLVGEAAFQVLALESNPDVGVPVTPTPAAQRMMIVPAAQEPVRACTVMVSPELTDTEKSSPVPQFALRLVAAVAGDGDASANPVDSKMPAVSAMDWKRRLSMPQYYLLRRRRCNFIGFGRPALTVAGRGRDVVRHGVGVLATRGGAWTPAERRAGASVDAAA